MPRVDFEDEGLIDARENFELVNAWRKAAKEVPEDEVHETRWGFIHDNFSHDLEDGDVCNTCALEWNMETGEVHTPDYGFEANTALPYKCEICGVVLTEEDE